MTDNAVFIKNRTELVEYLESQLIGPAEDESSLSFSDKPYERYLLGAIFPQGASKRRLEQDEDSSDTGASDEDDNPINLAYELMPASLGLSFFTFSKTIDIHLSAAIYLKKKDKQCWCREVLAERDEAETVSISIHKNNVSAVLKGYADLLSVWRKVGDGYLVTITLVNSSKAESNGKFDPGSVLHQVHMRCEPENGKIEGYPAPNRYSWDAEEEELALIYRNKKTFGIGHGCAAHWDPASADTTPWIETCFIPRYEVPPVTADLDDSHPLKNSDVFSIQYLADKSIDIKKKIRRLSEFITAYKNWIESQIDSCNIPEELEKASERIKERLFDAVRRMKKGLQLIGKDKEVQFCFCLANEAMLIQMIHSSRKYGGTIRDAGNTFTKPDYFSSNWSHFRWRPFQLAFQLLVIESMANRNSTDRDIVDLIWFPTGGGKTEAYLSVACFELFYRRIKYGDVGGGTTIIKRYTLRLLTTQQFERASTLICACESLRKQHSDELGDERFTLGLWVGQGTTPNKFKEAYQEYERLIDQDIPDNPYQLQRCPWCGTRIIPSRRDNDIKNYGVRAKADNFNFFCPEKTCEFHEYLPVNVVDEHLYREPPSLLIGTIDKFARLAWSDSPRSFFNGGPSGKRLPPSLIIQDELHLISGPLGTVAGLYESAMDVVMKAEEGKPKYIAATATIRRAAEQASMLYARGVSVFPPSGLVSDDSFFSREDRSHPGRLYIGILGQYHTPVTSLIHTSAALAQSVYEKDLCEESEDAYWTQVIFHNSRRELGKTMTLCRDDIPERIKVIAVDENKKRKRFEPEEMSANIPSQDIPVVLERLGNSRLSNDAVDVLPCTNMFSVGVDVQRLGLIVMNGQPKTTAEYIQASSRVGRGSVPGLVVALYPNNKARDRSHYESFIPYHQALYRAVEPTSVTPYALPAMERALHAAIVIVMRYCAGLSGNNDAANFNKNDDVINSWLESLLDRMKSSVGNDLPARHELEIYFEQCVDAWHHEATGHGSRLVYESRGAANFPSLLKQFEPGMQPKPEIPWATLNSMRNVDQECRVYVRGERDET